MSTDPFEEFRRKQEAKKTASTGTDSVENTDSQEVEFTTDRHKKASSDEVQIDKPTGYETHREAKSAVDEPQKPNDFERY